MTLGNPLHSSYMDEFNSSKKKKMPVESCKPKHLYNPIPNKMKYKTEYSNEFIQQSINEKKAFGCLSPDQLKNYVMTILND